MFLGEFQWRRLNQDEHWIMLIHQLILGPGTGILAVAKGTQGMKSQRMILDILLFVKNTDWPNLVKLRKMLTMMYLSIHHFIKIYVAKKCFWMYWDDNIAEERQAIKLTNRGSRPIWSSWTNPNWGQMLFWSGLGLRSSNWLLGLKQNEVLFRTRSTRVPNLTPILVEGQWREILRSGI